MKKFIMALSSIVLPAITFNASASFISNDDIDSLSITAPTGWNILYEDALFDGVLRQHGDWDKRFVGLRGAGDDITDTNPINVNIKLNSEFSITSFSLYNDWNYFLLHQITGLNVDFIDNGIVSSSHSFSNLDMNTFDEIMLLPALALDGIDEIDFNITGAQLKNIEITEFRIGAVNTAVSSVNTPYLGLLLSTLILGALYAGRAKNQ
ncbi:hypothetical protein [Agaribacter marinus]|uniref:PEP-CTERM sorting domain-containing protein n=1 Tax=Agaribacter marinus TaxID=1431249 RepID=A0AA37T0K0_9ALTE|nr:hypothetical protein [Agaribacter marinus]GLR72891.1 hypothetical protein GCM10007852_37990 [Agaribacter marinus]